MSNTPSYVSIALAWAGTAGGGVAMLKKYATKAEDYISHVEEEVNSVLTKLEALDSKLSAITTASAQVAKPAKPKAASKKIVEAPAPKKRLR